MYAKIAIAIEYRDISLEINKTEEKLWMRPDEINRVLRPVALKCNRLN